MQEPEPIDWEYYRKGVGSRLVDMYKQAYDGICLVLLCPAFFFYLFFFNMYVYAYVNVCIFITVITFP